MKNYLKFTALSIFSIIGSRASSQIKTAHELFKNGDFVGAQKIYKENLQTDPGHLKSLIYMGYTSLLFNRLNESEIWFEKVKEIKPDLSILNYFISEIYHRQNHFFKAAPFYRAFGKEAMAKKMEYFANIQPYEMNNSFQEITVKFLVTDPLPVVEVTINYVYKGHFIIDTGGGELILNDDFAKKSKADFFGIEKNNEFGGGKKAPIGHGAISSISLGEMDIKNIPIITLNLNQLELGGYKIDGIIGTVFLYQFLSTIDYKNHQLVLRNKTLYNYDNIINSFSECKIIPFILADDHFILANGKLNNSDTLLFFVDTGLAGNAFTCPKSTVKKFKLKYEKKHKNKGLGAGGYFSTYPMEIDSLSLGNLSVKNLHGIYGAFPKQIENGFGFKISGLISHEFFKNYSLIIDFESMRLIVIE